MDLSFTRRGAGVRGRGPRAGSRRTSSVPPRFETIADEVEFGRRWQAELAADRWVGIHWPREYGGRGASPVQVAIFNMEYARSRALAADQPGRHQPRRADAARARHRRAEAALAAGDPHRRARSGASCSASPTPAPTSRRCRRGRCRVDDGWLLSGQKVWTSYAQFARWGICLARTDADAPKHKGISYLVVDMQAPGIEIRPLVQITGDAEFNEVFFDEVFVPDDHLVGGLHNGWAVANTTLAHERGTAFPFKEQVVHEVYLDELWQLAADARTCSTTSRSPTRSRSRSSSCACCGCTTGARCRGWRKGIEPGPGVEHHEARVDRHDAGAVGARRSTCVGAAAPLWWGADDNPGGGFWQRQWLWSKAASIAGGTSRGAAHDHRRPDARPAPLTFDVASHVAARQGHRARPHRVAVRRHREVARVLLRRARPRARAGRRVAAR